MIPLVAAAAPPAAPRVALVGFEGETPAAIRDAALQRIARGLLVDGVAVVGPGDIERRIGAEARHATAMCIVDGARCPEGASWLDIDVLVALHAYRDTVTFVARTPAGALVHTQTFQAAPYAMLERLESVAHSAAPPIYQASSVPFRPTPPWGTWGLTAVGVGGLAAATTIVLTVDAARRYLVIAAGPSQTIPNHRTALEWGQVGQLEAYGALAAGAVAGAAFWAALYCAGRAHPPVPSSMRISLVLGPNGVAVAGVFQ